MADMFNLKQVVLPTGNFVTGPEVYSFVASTAKIIPNEQADWSTRSWMAVANFVGGLAQQYIAFLLALWNAYGVVANGLLFFLADATGRESLLGQHKIQLQNNLKACLIQGLFHVTMSSVISWWVLGMFNAFHCFSSAIGIGNLLDALQGRVTEWAKSLQEHRPKWKIWQTNY